MNVEDTITITRIYVVLQARASWQAAEKSWF